MRHLISLLLLLPICTAAQEEHRFNFAAGSNFGFKFDLINNHVDPFGMLADHSIDLGLKINGSNTSALGFYGSLGIGDDQLDYHLRINSVNFYIDRFYIPLKALILFPTKFEHLRIAAGIGLDFNIYFDESVSSSENYGYYAIDLNKIGDEVDRLANHIIPSFQVGGIYELNIKNQRFAIHLLAKQALLKLFTADCVVDYAIGQQPESLSINPQPTFLDFGFVYYF